jgi:hypothetical protein
MKFILKLLILIAVGYIIFDWVFYSNKDSKASYHFNCKLAQEGKMSGNPCAMCEKKFASETNKRIRKLEKQYEMKLGKPFLEFTSEEIIEMFKESVLAKK